MYKWRRLAGIIAIAGLAIGVGPASAEQCGDVTIASMNWASAEIIAEIDSRILSAGYGCNTQLISGDTLSIFESITIDGQPDIVPELWVNSLGVPFDTAIASGQMIMAAEVLADGGEQGWWIPRYIADAHPEIKTVEDALARPDLFPSSDDEQIGAVHNCPSGWGCEISTLNLFRAYSAEEKGFALIDTGSAAGLDASIAKAYEAGSGWLGYYWAPTSLLGRYEMVKLDMGVHDPLHWDNCTVVVDCADPKINTWPDGRVFSVVTGNFADRMKGPMEYINSRQWNNETVSKLLSWMANNQATGDEVARHFLENYEDVWTSWVSLDQKLKVKAAL